MFYAMEMKQEQTQKYVSEIEKCRKIAEGKERSSSLWLLHFVTCA